MPMKPKRPCSFPGCPNLTDRRFCPEHEKLEAQRDQKEAKALYLEKYPLDRAYQDWLKSDVSETAMLRSTRCVKSALRKVCTRQPRRFTTSSLFRREERTTAAI